MPQPDPATFTARVAGGTIHIGAFSPDSRYVAVTAGCRTTQIYDAYTGQQVGQVDAREEPGCFGINALLLPDNERLAVYMALPNGAGRLDVWNWHTGEPLSATALASWPPRFLYPVLCANRDGNRLVTLGQQGQVQVFDMATPAARPWRKWDGDQGFKWFRLSPDGCFLAGATPTSAVLWNIETGELRGHFDQQAEITDAAFSQDGRFLASSSRDGAVKVWNLQTQTLAAGPLVHPAHVYTVEFSPDGRYLLTIAKDASARVWNIASGQLAAAPITGFEDITARFRRAVSQLVLTDYEGHFEAWDWRRHQRLMPTQRLFWERAFAWSGQRSLVLSPDGRLAAVGGNKELHIVNLRPLDVTEVPPIQELVTEAEVLSHLRMLDTGATANLTFEEWYGRWESLRAARRGGQE
ncbi:MAG: WD40 repeat domain-containing protein, partial [Planctomycetota bacterium]|nr:WD40 repeat domain-containing protein [Planctomycetota bacterium]